MPRAVVPWAVVAASVAGFVTLAVRVAAGHLHGLDTSALRWVGAVRSASLTEVMRSVTHLGDGWTLGLVSVAASCVLWCSGSRRATVFLLCVSAGAGLLDNGLKLAFARPRPDVTLRMVPAAGFAFPSGHAMASAAVYAALAHVASGPSRSWRRWLMPMLAVVLVLVVGWSRVYLHVHYASDVLGGWLLGLGWYVLLRQLILGGGRSRALGPVEG
ncbi:MAG: phosphatase PAP2 family protein [Polyangiaceae bacterium]|nr:phosphatase PAP2 family protein [Polyangiaceae bacterium]